MLSRVPEPPRLRPPLVPACCQGWASRRRPLRLASSCVAERPQQLSPSRMQRQLSSLNRGGTPTLISTLSADQQPQFVLERIPFHRDSSLIVVNVALNEGFEGTPLMYALDGRVECPARPMGCATAHDCAAVHGVSCLVAGVRHPGVRYTLLRCLRGAAWGRNRQGKRGSLMTDGCGWAYN